MLILLLFPVVVGFNNQEAEESTYTSGVKESNILINKEVTTYPDNRPFAKYRLNATDYGVVYKHGEGTDVFNAYQNSDRVIEIVGKVTQKTIASMYDIQGKLLLTQSFDYGNRNFISIPSQMRGLYLLRICSDDCVSNLKIMII